MLQKFKCLLRSSQRCLGSQNGEKQGGNLKCYPLIEPELALEIIRTKATEMKEQEDITVFSFSLGSLLGWRTASCGAADHVRL